MAHLGIQSTANLHSNNGKYVEKEKDEKKNVRQGTERLNECP